MRLFALGVLAIDNSCPAFCWKAAGTSSVEPYRAVASNRWFVSAPMFSTKQNVQETDNPASIKKNVFAYFSFFCRSESLRWFHCSRCHCFGAEHSLGGEAHTLSQTAHTPFQRLRWCLLLHRDSYRLQGRSWVPFLQSSFLYRGHRQRHPPEWLSWAPAWKGSVPPQGQYKMNAAHRFHNTPVSVSYTHLSVFASEFISLNSCVSWWDIGNRVMARTHFCNNVRKEVLSKSLFINICCVSDNTDGDWLIFLKMLFSDSDSFI